MTEQQIAAVLLTCCAVLVGVKLLAPVVRLLMWSLFRFDSEVQKVRSEQKRSQVKLGRISETLAPFLDTFPVDVEKSGTATVFLGQPIDYIHFDPEEGVTFIEIKSGDSKLNANQRAIRDRIAEGKVHWCEVRIKGESN